MKTLYQILLLQLLFILNSVAIFSQATGPNQFRYGIAVIQEFKHGAIAKVVILCLKMQKLC